MKCQKCMKEIDESSRFCRFCGAEQIMKKVVSIEELNKEVYNNNQENISDEEDVVTDLDKAKKALNLEIKCPYCSSKSFHYEKKGYSVGKAVVGVALVGTVGLLGGAIGSNDRIRICDGCGKQF